MEIILIRHGKPLFDERKWLIGSEFSLWVKQYDLSGVQEEDSYPKHSSQLVVTSDLKRSIDSAQLLNPNEKVIADPLFREVELPVMNSDLRLSPRVWTILLRLVWLSGYSRGCESYQEAKRRAAAASAKLVEWALIHDSIMLVGHGFFNMLIAKELLKSGWTGKRKAGSKYWSSTVYTLEGDA
jgi:broad specificity phosphatase PhoE